MVERVTPGTTTSPIFRFRGQRSRWRYPHERLTPEHAVDMNDINLSERGAAEVRRGFEKYNTTTLPSSEAVVGLYQGSFSTGLGQLVVTPTKVYVDDGTTRTDATGSLTLSVGGDDDRYRFAQIYDGTGTDDVVVATNGKDEIWQKGSDFSSPGNAAALTFTGGVTLDTCDDLFTHNGLLIAVAPTESSTKYPTRIRWCDINTQTFRPDIRKWVDINRFEVIEGGAALVGGVDNFGYALLFKKDGMYPGRIVYTQGFNEFRMEDPVRGFSPIAKNSIIARPEFVFGIAKEGAFVIRPDLSYEVVTLDIQELWDLLNPARLQYAVSWIREQDHQIRTLLSSATNSAAHDRILVYDWETGDVWFDEPGDALNHASRVVLSNQELDWFGTEDGLTFKGNGSGVTDDNGTAISWTWEGAANDLGLPGRTKTIRWIRVYYTAVAGISDFNLEVKLDQGSKSSRSKEFSVGSGLLWDNGVVWDSGLLWPGQNIVRVDFWVNRQCETLAPRFTGSDNVKLRGYQCEFTTEE